MSPQHDQHEMPTFSDAPSTSAPTNSPSGRSNFRTSVINLERPGDPSVFGDDIRADAQKIIAKYPEGQSRSALLPLLHLVQSVQGYVSPDGIAFCSDTLGLTKAQVSAVATFYTMYKRQPTGEYLVSVCTNTLCGLLGGDEIFGALKEQLGVAENGTTDDGRITLEHAECLAGCDYAPVVTVNYEFYDNQTVGSARALVSELQSGGQPQPTRGGPLCTFKQIERQIAGLHDAEGAFSPEATATGAPTQAGVKLALERGDTAPSYATDPGSDAPAASAEASAETAAKTPAKKATRKAAAKKTAQAEQPGIPGMSGNQEESSASDQPLHTAESDPSNPTDPAGETEKED
ncbi:NADH-quinone oxidoreductase subunit NuoE [Jatrophihabitans fulvus]